MPTYRKIWEKHFGEIPIDENGRSYEIHHIDGNRKNNSIKNLKCVSIEEHLQIHLDQKDEAAIHAITIRMNGNSKGWKHSEETKKKMKQSAMGKPGTNVGRIWSKETNEKRSNSLKGKKRSQEVILKLRKPKSTTEKMKGTRKKIHCPNCNLMLGSSGIGMHLKKCKIK
jgi:hypothetical protein